MKKINNSNFKRLIGVWKTTGMVKSQDVTQKLSGTDTYEFILEENYILHKANVKMGKEKSETFEVFSLDNSLSKSKMQYFNSKGEAGSMKSSIIDNEFIIEGTGLKFTGNINAENTLITGKWFEQTKYKDWKEFIVLKLEKQ